MRNSRLQLQQGILMQIGASACGGLPSRPGQDVILTSGYVGYAPGGWRCLSYPAYVKACEVCFSFCSGAGQWGAAVDGQTLPAEPHANAEAIVTSLPRRQLRKASFTSVKKKKKKNFCQTDRSLRSINLNPHDPDCTL